MLKSAGNESVCGYFEFSRSAPLKYNVNNHNVVSGIARWLHAEVQACRRMPSNNPSSCRPYSLWPPLCHDNACLASPCDTGIVVLRRTDMSSALEHWNDLFRVVSVVGTRLENETRRWFTLKYARNITDFFIVWSDILMHHATNMLVSHSAGRRKAWHATVSDEPMISRITSRECTVVTLHIDGDWGGDMSAHWGGDRDCYEECFPKDGASVPGSETVDEIPNKTAPRRILSSAIFRSRNMKSFHKWYTSLEPPSCCVQ